TNQLAFADKTPLERTKILETTDLLANVHAEAAAGGQTAAPDASTHTDLHFTCFVSAPTAEARMNQTPAGKMRLIELDGRRAGPVDRGECTDLLKVCCIFFVMCIRVWSDGAQD